MFWRLIRSSGSLEIDTGMVYVDACEHSWCKLPHLGKGRTQEQLSVHLSGYPEFLDL